MKIAVHALPTNSFETSCVRRTFPPRRFSRWSRWSRAAMSCGRPRCVPRTRVRRRSCVQTCARRRFCHRTCVRLRFAAQIRARWNRVRNAAVPSCGLLSDPSWIRVSFRVRTILAPMPGARTIRVPIPRDATIHAVSNSFSPTSLPPWLFLLLRVVQLHRQQGIAGRPVHHPPLRIEPRAVTGAIKALFRSVPVNDATQVRTGRAEYAYTAVVAISGVVMYAPADHCAVAGGDVLQFLSRTRTYPVRVLPRDVGVLACELADSPDRLARRFVQLCPLIAPAGNQVRDDHSRQRPLRHPVARVTAMRIQE